MADAKAGKRQWGPGQSIDDGRSRTSRAAASRVRMTPARVVGDVRTPGRGARLLGTSPPVSSWCKPSQPRRRVVAGAHAQPRPRLRLRLAVSRPRLQRRQLFLRVVDLASKCLEPPHVRRRTLGGVLDARTLPKRSSCASSPSCRPATPHQDRRRALPPKAGCNSVVSDFRSRARGTCSFLLSVHRDPAPSATG